MNKTGSPQMRKSGRGFTLIELMISITIALVIMAAIGYMFQTSKLAFNTSQGMARVQDNARTAQLLLNSIVREAGYIDDVVTYSDPSTVFTTPAFSLHGGSPSTITSTFSFVSANPTYSNTATDESSPAQLLNRDYLEVAFVGDSIGAMVNCLGSTIDASHISINIFYIDKANSDAVPSLYCITRTVSIGSVSSGTTFSPTPIVAGITGLQVTYGYDSDGNGSIDSYVPASLVTNWTYVKSMTIRLTAESDDIVNPAATTASLPNYTNSAGTQTMQAGRLTRPVISTLQVRNRLVKL